jgi:hypothetical protein
MTDLGLVDLTTPLGFITTPHLPAYFAVAVLDASADFDDRDVLAEDAERQTVEEATRRGTDAGTAAFLGASAYSLVMSA